MRRILPLLILIPLLGLSVLYLRPASPAADLIDRSFAPSWSANEQLIASLEDRVRKDPTNVKANAMLGEAYLQRARESGDPANYTKAGLFFEQALKQDPKSVDALLGKASLLMVRHNFAEAKDVAATAIQIDPNVVASYGVLTDALIELGEHDAAVRTLDTMMRKKPNLSSYSRVSYIRELKGDIPGAIEAMQMAIDSGAPNGENTAWCMVQLGKLYFSEAQVDQAETQFRRALVRFPEYAHAFAGLARVAAQRNDLETAAQQYSMALERMPLAEFAVGLAEVYQRMGRQEDARAQFELALAIDEVHHSNGVSSEGGLPKR